jgi:hypothetical protein
VELAFVAIAAIVAVASMVMTAYQTRLMARATELSFNLQVMERLQDVLWAAADDADSHAMAWGQDATDNRRPQLSVHAIIDILSMALAACDRLPGFSRNQEDWHTYAADVLRASPALRAEVLSHPKYWPEVLPFAEAAQREAGDRQ